MSRSCVVFVAMFAAGGGCKSSAPYTAPAAAINTALAAGASAQQRAQGGCYAVCTAGTSCNPKTGYCEPVSQNACATPCQTWEVCVENEAGIGHCAPGPSQTISRQRPGASDQPGGITPRIGPAPTTGTVPTLPPTKASPENP